MKKYIYISPVFQSHAQCLETSDVSGQFENPEENNSQCKSVKYFTLLFSLVDLSTSELCKDRSYSISASVLTPHCYHYSDFGDFRVYINGF